MSNPTRTTVGLLVLDDVFDTGLAVVRDALETANALADGIADSTSTFRVIEIGLRSRVRTHQGRVVTPQRLSSLRRKLDVVFVPGLASKSAPEIERTLRRRDCQESAELLRSWYGRGMVCAAACTGTFLMAESGLLDGSRATTSWWAAPLFRQRYPDVELDEARMVVESRRLLTAGAALAHLDAALALVRRVSPQLARAVAEHLVLDARASQAAFVIPSYLARADPLVERFEGWARKHLASTLPMSAAAKALATTERTLERRVGQLLGKTPIAFLQDLRVERAAHLLRTTDAGLDEIAGKVGYSSATTLGVLLRRQLGLGARELRKGR